MDLHLGPCGMYEWIIQPSRNHVANQDQYTVLKSCKCHSI